MAVYTKVMGYDIYREECNPTGDIYSVIIDDVKWKFHTLQETVSAIKSTVAKEKVVNSK